MLHFYWNYKCIWYLLFTTDIHIKYRVTIMKKYQVNINNKINKNISEIILFDSKLTLKTNSMRSIERKRPTEQPQVQMSAITQYWQHMIAYMIQFDIVRQFKKCSVNLIAYIVIIHRRFSLPCINQNMGDHSREADISSLSLFWRPLFIRSSTNENDLSSLMYTYPYGLFH